jgi:hypothetical protein
MNDTFIQIQISNITIIYVIFNNVYHFITKSKVKLSVKIDARKCDKK